MKKALNLAENNAIKIDDLLHQVKSLPFGRKKQILAFLKEGLIRRGIFKRTVYQSIVFQYDNADETLFSRDFQLINTLESLLNV